MNTVSNSSGYDRRRSIIVVAGALALAVALYASWAAWRAHRNLVTLDVRDMDVRVVVKKISAQTWEDIFVHKDVQGKVTLKVKNMPLEQVLRVLGDQTFSRSSLIYPLYSTHNSLLALRKSLRGEVDPATQGWTNLQSRILMGAPFGGGGFGGPGMGRPFGGPMGASAQNQLVSLNLFGKDVGFAALAFNRFAQTRVVPEDGASASVNLVIKQATVPKAVSKLAKAANLKWAKVYALQGGPGGPGGGFQAFGEPNGRRGFGGPDMTDEQREEARKKREALEAELKSALPPDELSKLEQAQADREKQMQDFASMSDDQRRDRMMQNNGAAIAQMARDRMMNSTPEQRAKMGQRMNQMRREGGPGGGRGGPGGGGRGPQ